MKKTLGMLISETRKQKGMTQLELAEKMGVTDKAVSKWERDLSCPDVSSLPLLWMNCCAAKMKSSPPATLSANCSIRF